MTVPFSRVEGREGGCNLLAWQEKSFRGWYAQIVGIDRYRKGILDGWHVCNVIVLQTFDFLF